MSSNLVRAYFYVMYGVMLTVFAVALGSLLGSLLDLLGSGPYNQGVAVGLIVSIFSIAVGTPHYLWIRRDRATDPGAAASLVRSLTLNLTQALAALFALFGGIFYLKDAWSNPSSSSISFIVPAVVVFGLVQLERGRAQPVSGPSAVAQRVHLYLLQITIVLAIILAVVPDLLDAFMYSPLLASNLFSDVFRKDVNDSQPVPVILLITLGGIGAWLLYWWLAHSDTGSTLRLVSQFFGFSAGLVCILVGAQRLTYVAIRLITNGITTGDLPPDGVLIYCLSPLVIGLLVVAGYGRWLVRESPQSRLARPRMVVTALTLLAAVSGVPFYFGIARLLEGAVLSTAYPQDLQLAYDPASLGTSLLVAGVAHPILAYLLRRRSLDTRWVNSPRQAYLLAGLGIGLLTIVITSGFSLFFASLTTVTNPNPNREGGSLGSTVLKIIMNLPTALGEFRDALTKGVVPGGSTGVVLFFVIPLLVSGFIATVHYRRARAEGVLQQGSAQAPAQESVAVSIGSILDELRDEHITREQAMTQLQELAHTEKARGRTQ